MIVYLITNKINGKQYVGQTTRSLSDRWKFHCSSSSGCLAIKSAIIKYGKENFDVEAIFNACTEEELNEKEIEFISKFNTISPNGYNLKTGGNRPIYSQESRKKMSLSRKAYRQSKESNKKGAIARTGSKNWAFGKKFTEEHRKNLSEARKGNRSHLGHKHSDETKLKISLSHLGKIPWNKGLTKEDPRVARMIRSGEKSFWYGKTGSRKGTVCSKETREKISRSTTGRKYTAEEREARSKTYKRTTIICNQNGKTYNSIAEAGRELNINTGQICHVLNGKHSHAKGYTFLRIGQ